MDVYSKIIFDWRKIHWNSYFWEKGISSSIECTIEIKLEFKFASQVKFPPPQHSSKIMYLYLIRMLQRNTSKTCHTLGSWNYEKPM